MKLKKIYKGHYQSGLAMNKEIKILKIMKEEKCDWEEAKKREKERKELHEFF